MGGIGVLERIGLCSGAPAGRGGRTVGGIPGQGDGGAGGELRSSPPDRPSAGGAGGGAEGGIGATAAGGGPAIGSLGADFTGDAYTGDGSDRGGAAVTGGADGAGLGTAGAGSASTVDRGEGEGGAKSAGRTRMTPSHVAHRARIPDPGTLAGSTR